jgi:hypothetical protein
MNPGALGSSGTAAISGKPGIQRKLERLGTLVMPVKCGKPGALETTVKLGNPEKSGTPGIVVKLGRIGIHGIHGIQKG